MHPSDLENAINRQSWEWLFDLPHRLNVVIEVIDAHDVPRFPAGSTRGAATIRRMLAAGEPSLHSALAEVVRSATPAALTLDGYEALCFRLPSVGALMLARELTGDASAVECRRDLELIGSWLAGAIEASLTGPPNAISVEPYRIVSLQRILNAATARGSFRKVIGAFVEALGVWDDVRVRGYAAGASGGFFQYVSPVGTLAPSVPAELDDGVVRDTQMVRLSRIDLDRIGLSFEPGDVLVTRIVTADIAWLLVFSGPINSHEQVRLMLYSDMLRESLNDVLAATINRVVAGVTRHQVPVNEPLEAAAQAALGQLTAAVGGGEAALVVTTVPGRQALAIGNSGLLAAPDQARINRLVVTSSDAGSIMTVGIVREQPPFTAFEREIVQAGVAALHPWLRAALQRSNEIERRRQFRPVDTVFEQLAAEALDAGQQTSVIVMEVDASMLRHGVMTTLLRRIRAQMRAGDFAGILSDTEIALLLRDASAEQAAVVSARLKQLIESETGADPFASPAIGVTTCSPGSRFQGSIVGAARGALEVR